MQDEHVLSIHKNDIEILIFGWFALFVDEELIIDCRFLLFPFEFYGFKRLVIFFIYLAKLVECTQKTKVSKSFQFVLSPSGKELDTKKNSRKYF
jgi:hypothetical protein